MQSIPTLCASGCLVGAAGVGFGFGLGPAHDSSSPLASTRFDSQPHLQSQSPAMTDQSPPLDSQRLPKRRFSSGNGFFSRSASSNGTLLRRRSAQLDLRQASQSSPTVPARHAALNDSHSESPDSTGKGQARPDSEKDAWVEGSVPHRVPSRLRMRKTLSYLGLSSQFTPPASSSPDSRPPSRPQTHSSNSSIPFFPSNSHQAPPQRKRLVKRSLSQRAFSGQRLGQTTDDPPRPGTSHSALTMSSELPGLIHEGTAEQKISCYFSVVEISTLVAKSPTAAEDKPVRRLLPARGVQPLLCSVKALLNPPSARVAQQPQPLDRKRPLSSASNLNIMSSPGPTVEEPDLERPAPPRRSLSISDFLSKTARRNESQKKFRVKLARRVPPPSPQMESDEMGLRGAVSTLHHLDVMPDWQQPRPYTPPSMLQLTPPVVYHASKPTVPAFSRTRTPNSNISVSSTSAHSKQSDFTSSHLGSDSDGRVFSSADEDEARSDTAYDSMRTGVTRNSGFKVNALETLFDRDSPSYEQDHRFSFERATSPSLQTIKTATVGDGSSTSTPGKTNDKRQSHRSSGHDTITELPSSPPSMPKALSLGRLAWDENEGSNNFYWSDSDDADDDNEDNDDTFPIGDNSPLGLRGGAARSNRFSVATDASAATSAKGNLFDWSEPPSLDRTLSTSPPARPKTVHGKKNTAEARPGRPGPSAGAGAGLGPRRGRVPSGAHARSQSVPVMADGSGSSHRPAAASKFGTWGVGSKGVSEDWNDDFDFEDLPASAGAAGPSGSAHSPHTPLPGGLRAPSPQMVVPDSIKAQQTKVLANIGLLKEWGILIEELKDLRARLAVLGIGTAARAGAGDGAYDDDLPSVFDEVDAMIDLADQEVPDDKAAVADRSPHSWHSSSPPPPAAAADSSSLGTLPETIPEAGPPQTGHQDRRRPRKNSEAVAQTVIETLRRKRPAHAPGTAAAAFEATPRQKQDKIPFDTRTLKDIVPHVGGLVLQVKQILRDAEGLQASPMASPKAPRRRG